MKRMLLLFAWTLVMCTSQSRADAVIDWSATAMTVMLRVPALARSPLHDMAYLHIAIYDAVNAIDGQYSVFAVAPSNAAPWASREAATAAAARRVLLTFYASQQPYIDSVYTAALALLPNDSTTTRGAAIGDTVATRFLALRAGDGRDATITYVWQSPGPGVYQPTPPGAAQTQPLNPWLGQLRTFSNLLTSQFRAAGPPTLTSDAYTKDFNEVKRYGSLDSSFTTPQQREIARFHTENPNAQVARNIRLFAISRAMSLADNARLFAQIYVTIGDALITGFDAKYLYNNWRPSTAIRQADSDGNPLTLQDTLWRPLVNTPTHPEYVAAHGCTLGAFAYALQKFFGTSNIPVTLTSLVTGTSHSFTNISEIVTEAANARVFGGMHFRSSVDDGLAIGRDVAGWVARRYFIRLSASPWTIQRAIGLPTSTNPDVVLSAVSERVCWGIKNTSDRFIRTTDGGATWTTSVVVGATGLVGSSISALDSGTAYAAVADLIGQSRGGIFKTTDGGTGWVKQLTAFPSGAGGYPDAIHFFDANHGVCVGDPNNGYWEIYTTADGGSHWTRVPSTIVLSALPGDFSAGEVFASVGNCAWFGTYMNSVYRSTDRGVTWSVALNVMGIGSNGPFIAFRDSLNGLGCLAFTNGAGNRMARTTDGGLTWTQIAASSIPATPSVYFPASIPGTHSYVITSTSNIGFPTPTTPGSAFSIDDGLTWTQIDNLPHEQTAFASSRVGWSSGQNDVIYKWDNNLGTSVDKKPRDIVEGYQLEQNYPNPFNPSTKIAFHIMKAGQVKLKVIDIMGREVQTLVDEQLQPGSYESTFNAKGLASGVYLYRLQAGDFVVTKRLLLLK